MAFSTGSASALVHATDKQRIRPERDALLLLRTTERRKLKLLGNSHGTNMKITTPVVLPAEMVAIMANKKPVALERLGTGFQIATDPTAIGGSPPDATPGAAAQASIDAPNAGSTDGVLRQAGLSTLAEASDPDVNAQMLAALPADGTVASDPTPQAGEATS